MEKSIVLTAIYYGEGDYTVFIENVTEVGDHTLYPIHLDNDIKPCSTFSTKRILDELSEYIYIEGINRINYYDIMNVNFIDGHGNWTGSGHAVRPMLVQPCDLYGNPLDNSTPTRYMEVLGIVGGTRYIKAYEDTDMQSVGELLQKSPYIDANAPIVDRKSVV